MFDDREHLPRTPEACYQIVHLEVTPGHWEGLAGRNKESGQGSELEAVSPPLGKEALGRLGRRASRPGGQEEQMSGSSFICTQN